LSPITGRRISGDPFLVILSVYNLDLFDDRFRI
jgi:hypothetical protein